MSDLQGESSNQVNDTTALVAGTDWNGTNAFILQLHAPGLLGGPAPGVDVDGLQTQGHGGGVGVVGWANRMALGS
jgi:hypothetical protein